MAGQQIRRGLKANIPTLSDGEWGFCTDTGEIYIGSTTGNKKISDSDDWVYLDGQDQAVKTMSGPTFAHVHLTSNLYVGANQVIGAQAAAQADLTTTYSEANTRAETLTALNATNTAFNTLLAKLRTHGIIDT